MDKKRIVKAGYEAVASQYSETRARGSEDVKLLDDFTSRIPEGGLVLDAGCGGGVPIAQSLASSYQVVGVDLANQQIRRARSQVPFAEFLIGDIVHLPFRDGSFDGVCSYYAIIHVPREEHHDLVREIFRVLKRSGIALLCMGEDDNPADVAEYMGTPMFWSHFDAATNNQILLDTGFEVLSATSVVDFQDPRTYHRFFFARKP